MASNQTENYGLNQWESEDKVLRTDFNADNAKIDAALGALSAERIYVGSYVGDGTTGRVIQLAFAPKFALVMGHIYTSSMFGIFTPETNWYDCDNSWGSSSQYNLQIVDDTFVVKNSDWNNQSGKTVRYILVR